MNKDFRTVSACGISAFSIKGSRFTGAAFPCGSREELSAAAEKLRE